MDELLRIFAFLDANVKLTLYYDWRPANLDFSKVQSSYDDFKVYYRDAVEELPRNMPKPRGRSVRSHAYVDASHAANKKTRRSHVMLSLSTVHQSFGTVRDRTQLSLVPLDRNLSR